MYQPNQTTGLILLMGLIVSGICLALMAMIILREIYREKKRREMKRWLAKLFSEEVQKNELR